VQTRAPTRADAEAIAAWRYPGRYATYDVAEAVDAARGFMAVEDGGELVGFCCFGAEARVPGVVAVEGTADVGYGLRPDLMGGGHGRAFVGAILEHAEQKFPGSRLRLVVLSWNERSRRVAEALGFEVERTVSSREGEYLVMTRAPA
jgi:RimJ/RimL family protein N-acetyltransferase